MGRGWEGTILTAHEADCFPSEFWNYRLENGYTALMAAAENSLAAVVDVLLARWIDPHETGEENHTAAFVAAEFSPACLQKLLDVGAAPPDLRTVVSESDLAEFDERVKRIPKYTTHLTIDYNAGSDLFGADYLPERSAVALAKTIGATKRTLPLLSGLDMSIKFGDGADRVMDAISVKSRLNSLRICCSSFS